MGRSNDNMDLRKIRRLLRETTRLAERASMTGSLQGGGRIAIRQYNAIRNHLQDTGVIPEDLFQELDEDEATFDELGVVTGMLESYLEDEDEIAPDVEGEAGPEDRDARRAARRGRRQGRFEWGAWLGPEGARFGMDPQALRDLQQMGEELREHLPEMLKWREHMRSGHPAPPTPTPPTPPVPPTPPRQPQGWRQSYENEASPGDPPNGPPPPPFGGSDAAARIHQISEALAQEDLDHSRRMELAKELSELAAAQMR